ncbi:Histone H1 [Psilocybe cubensis]|uniref:Histone H1 n=1 Tax=Psilocybe cubensis TaxID=181762 RepID=A0ACB8H7S7_PSICU|nr:Histone H1 [Psilocybe cubensis]KAH9484038.1 Histone H1 [Psilocybe cubensis]
MSTASKKASGTAKPTVKKSSVAKPAASHPTWVDMIKECIAANTEDARIGVSRPQIKKYVETKYKLEIGAAQVNQLSKAITSGAEKGVFFLPKGLSGRVKLAPKSKPAADSSAAKENKPATKPKAAASKPKAAKASATTAKPKASKPSTTKTAAPKKAAPAKPKATTAVKKTPAPKKVLAGKPKAKTASTTKKTMAASKKAPAKKARCYWQNYHHQG